MCLIIYKPNPNQIIPDNIVRSAEFINEDGFGITFLDNGETWRTIKDYSKAAHVLTEVERPFVAHYRYATVGAVNKSNCHPFKFTDSQGNDHVLFSNGTVKCLGDKKKTDTECVAEILSQVDRKDWKNVLKMTDTRFAIVDLKTLEVSTYGKWHKRGGVFYSKDDCFPFDEGGYYDWDDFYYEKRHARSYLSYKQSQTSSYSTDLDDCPFDGPQDDVPIDDESNFNFDEEDLRDWKGNHLIAVYGTLKEGFGNHQLISKARYVGSGYTEESFAMQCGTIPFVYENYAGNNIAVEVYDVSSSQEMRDNVDSLEGHPWMYERKETSVLLRDGSTETCWLYFYQGDPDPEVPLYSEFKHEHQGFHKRAYGGAL